MNEKHRSTRLKFSARTGECAAILAIFTAVSPASVNALGPAVPNQDAEAIARGNAFIATANNASAIYYNPAGISQLDGIHAQFGAHNLALNSSFESLDGSRHANTRWEVATVPQLYGTFSRKNSPLSFGVGLYAPFGLGVEWRTNTPFRTLGVESRLSYIALNPVVAWKVLPNLSIAAGPTVNYAKVMLRQGIGLSAGDEFRFHGDGWDFGATAGLLWKPHEQWAVGVDYRSPTTINFDGGSRLKPYAASEDTSLEFPFPQSIGCGIAYRPTPHWNVEIYGIWTDWDTVKTVTFNRRQSSDIPFVLNWEASVMAGIGASRYFDNGWFVSAGYFFSQHSTSEKYFTPLVPDTDLHVGSVGCGYKGKRWSFALAAQIVTGPARTIRGSPTSAAGETADGKYQWFNQSLNFSVGYHF